MVAGVSSSTADPPTADMMREIVALFKDAGPNSLADLEANNVNGMQAICGKVNGRPFRVLTHRDGRISNPLSFMVSTDQETARYIMMLCYADRG
jgi:hypothetical protein